MTWNGQQDAQIGRIVRRSYQIIMAFVGIAGWHSYLSNLHLAIDNFWRFIPFPEESFFFALGLTASLAFLTSVFPAIRRALAYPQLRLHKFRQEQERIEVSRRNEAVTIIEQLIELHQGFLSLEGVSLIEICKEELGKVNLLPEVELIDQTKLMMYLERIKPYVQMYGIDRARQEGRKFLDN